MSRRGSTQLLLLFFRSRKRLGWTMGTIATILILAGLVQAAGEFPVMTRTGLAQVLRQSAWQHALAGLPEQPVWPWSETPSVAASSVPRLGLSASVATDADTNDGSVIAPVERVSADDPHLPRKEFGKISIGDRITVTRADGSSRVYRVTGCRVVDPHLAESESGASEENSALACPQLDRELADSLGLVIQATKADPPARPERKPEQKL
jgi:hypothetical protein